MPRPIGVDKAGFLVNGSPRWYVVQSISAPVGGLVPVGRVVAASAATVPTFRLSGFGAGRKSAREPSYRSARAYLSAGDAHAAGRALVTADRIAPTETRIRPAAHAALTAALRAGRTPADATRLAPPSA